MRHRHSRIRLRQKPVHARLMRRNLVTSLLLYEAVRTTKKRAEVTRPVIDTLIHYAKKHNAQQSIRYVNRFVTDKNACRKIMEVFVKRFANRPSGLTRMVPVGARKGDGAKLVDLSFVEGASVQKRTTAGKEVRSTKPASRSKKAS